MIRPGRFSVRTGPTGACAADFRSDILASVGFEVPSLATGRTTPAFRMIPPLGIINGFLGFIVGFRLRFRLDWGRIGHNWRNVWRKRYLYQGSNGADRGIRGARRNPCHDRPMLRKRGRRRKIDVDMIVDGSFRGRKLVNPRHDQRQ